MVEAGDALVVLTDIAASAGRDQVTQDLVNNLASIDRLTALLDGADALDFDPLDPSIEISPDTLSDILARQRDLFAQQNRRLSADVRVLQSRADGLAESARNKQAQIDGQVPRRCYIQRGVCCAIDDKRVKAMTAIKVSRP